MKINKRCSICSLFFCCHNKRIEEKSSPLALSPGEHIDNIIDAFSVNQGSSSMTESKRVFVPPPPVLSSPRQTVNLTKDHCPPPSTETNDSDILASPNTWVSCNICSCRIHGQYLDTHLKAHIQTYVPRHSSTTGASTAMVRYGAQIPSTTTTTTHYTKQPSQLKISAQEKYRFRKLEAVSIQSTTNKTGRYSDMTVVFWDTEKPVAQSAVYSGTGYSTISKDWERVCIHIVHNTIEDYYTLSVKLLKRANYSAWDNEEGIPDRICLQEELRTEIKRALLFFRINPMNAYRLFRKEWKGDFAVDKSEDGRITVVKSQSMKKLSERLNKQPQVYNHTSYIHSNGYGMYGGEGRGYQGGHRTTDYVEWD
jgi:hypothetical protein